jgi:hypothetical protein
MNESTSSRELVAGVEIRAVDTADGVMREAMRETPRAVASAGVDCGCVCEHA